MRRWNRVRVNPSGVRPPRATPAQRRAAATAKLRRTCPRIAAIIERVGPYRPRLTRDPFHALIGSIVHQQISMAAAKTVMGRLLATCGGALEPHKVLSLSATELRSAGLSRQKAGYLQNIATFASAGRLARRRLGRMADEAVVAEVTQVKGVGVWTAQMLLMFCLERLDVWPVDDLGLRAAFQRYERLDESPAKSEMLEVGERFAPQRSVAAWYLWRSLETGIEVSIDA